MKSKLLFLFLLIVFSYSVAGQQPIILMNPSFEDPPFDSSRQKNIPLCCKAPRGWYACGGADLNTPDAQPGNFGVILPAIDGEFHLGMVTRDNDTWEGICQRLKKSIQSDSSYFFSLALARSDSLFSDSRRTGKPAKYDRPIKFRIFGGNGSCQRLELLAETKPIIKTQWEYYQFTLKPKRTYSHLTIEAFYKTPTPIPYNGNILLDDLSPIIPISADTDDLISKIINERKKRAQNFDPVKRREEIEKAAKSNTGSQPVPESLSHADKLNIEKIKTQEKAFKQRIEKIRKLNSKKTEGPITWEFILKKMTPSKYQFYCNAKIKDGWKLYSLLNKEFKGEMGVKITLEAGNYFMVTNDLVESTNYKIEYDDLHKSEVRLYKSDASFGSFLTIINERKPIFGTITYVQSHEDGMRNSKSLEFVILADSNEILFEKPN